jgi:mRNA-degrading endonuclease RelE of RelBE toxin-antitoxin system
MAKRVDWKESAKDDLRGIDQAIALDILHAIARYVKTGEGDIKKLIGVKPAEWRLRAGDYRVRFYEEKEFLFVRSVKHRREAYR